jgi:hypothetical protein
LAAQRPHVALRDALFLCGAGPIADPECLAVSVGDRQFGRGDLTGTRKKISQQSAPSSAEDRWVRRIYL